MFVLMIGFFKIWYDQESIRLNVVLLINSKWVRQINATITDLRPAQWHSQNAEIAAQIKGRLLDHAVILFNYVPFQNGNFS